jgi:hypothetical protein
MACFGKKESEFQWLNLGKRKSGSCDSLWREWEVRNRRARRQEVRQALVLGLLLRPSSVIGFKIVIVPKYHTLEYQFSTSLLCNSVLLIARTSWFTEPSLVYCDAKHNKHILSKILWGKL